MRGTTLSVLVLVAALLAGCANAPTAPAAGNGSTATMPAPLPPITKSFEVSSDANGPNGDVNVKEGTFEVPTGYSRLHAESKWACATPAPACAYGIYTKKGGNQQDQQQDASKPLDVKVTPGAYIIGLRSTAPGAQMKGAIAITLT